ncbi:MAG: hypothetical protein II740_08650 [Lachnospiraceae bacterium]|jgi:hypothetical protein|nr:hypothetical protein [Lachnospiraceae bacterium]MBQ9863510.1 hypothetical protein [Lachnospiraceae bacterium]MCR4933894.1 DUF6145 family protein [Lachnospiraceae bacterium]
MEKTVICAANAYEEKYYLNPVFSKIPESIKKELNIICVLFTEEVGGIITIGFDEEGELEITTQASDEDYMYDEIAAGLLVNKIRATRQELFESLNLFYRVIVLGEDISLDEE